MSSAAFSAVPFYGLDEFTHGDLLVSQVFPDYSLFVASGICAAVSIFCTSRTLHKEATFLVENIVTKVSIGWLLRQGNFLGHWW